MPEGFFQAHSRLTGRKPPAPPPTGGAAPLTVTQLSKKIETAIKSGVPGFVNVQGEISNFRAQRTASGHLYFTMKDPAAAKASSAACIDCVMWQEAAAQLRFQLTDGLEVLAVGKVGVYAERGKYQLYINSLSPLGKGALELAFQQLKAKLEKEGLFAAERKKELPRYPLRIALLTSASTAALQDMLKVLRRFPWLSLSLYDVPVQGKGAAEKIATGIAQLNLLARFDCILLARGGGSLEDLWAFNEEPVARAIVASSIPIVTGIGHEVDVSIADLAADHHAHTPTEAAQIVTAHWRNANDAVSVSATRLQRAMRQIVKDALARLSSIARNEIFRRPLERLRAKRQLLDDRQRALALVISGSMRNRRAELTEIESRWAQRHPRHSIALLRAKLDSLDDQLRRSAKDANRRRQTRLQSLESHLNAIGPEQVLRRGYTITTRKSDGKPLRSAAEVKPGQALLTRLADGQIESVAVDPRQPSLF